MTEPHKKNSEKNSGKSSSSLDARTTLIEEVKYDSVPYESHAYPQTHPDKLHTIAKLFHMAPVDIDKARILELGCAGGGNLMPVALAHPKAECIGLDLSGEQIAQANALKNFTGAKNVTFEQADISNLPKDLGKFDYIICHGVFSWVPEKVRAAILETCKNHLSADGLAVISYNVLPGWGAVKTLRDMMMYHTQSFTDHKQQIQEAKNLLTFLHENTPGTDSSYKSIIERELEILKNTNDSYVFHEHLETENHQFYLHDFVKQSHAHGLTYVSDTEISAMYLDNFSPKVRQTLSAIKDIVRQEQYIDFLINRRFRHTILTLASNATKINRSVKQGDIMNFYIQANFTPEAPGPQGKVRFKKSDSTNDFTVNDKAPEAMMTLLAGKDRPVKIADLMAELKKNPAYKDAKNLESVFINNGMTLVFQNFITLRSTPVEFATTLGKKPKAYSLARYQAAQPALGKVTNLKMVSLNVDAFTKYALGYMDGKHTVDAIVKKLIEHVKKGDLNVQKDGKRIHDDKALNEIILPHTEQIMNKMAALAMFET